MIRILIIAILMVVGAPSAIGQAHTLFGSVQDERGAFLTGATVFLRSADADSTGWENGRLFTTYERYDISGPDGGYSIEGVDAGTYDVSAYLTGHRLVTRRVTITDRDVGIDLTLPMLEGKLDEVLISDYSGGLFGMSRLRPVDVAGVAIYESKKSEVIRVADLTANLATNNSRQIYSKVAGLNIWESDGAGVQLGLGGRGLSPNRNSNFNTRQNGYDIAADALGYPESYYTPPVQALERIEIVRGAASLQYGTQFGGLLNFVFKDGPEDESFELTSNQSAGSYGLWNTFNSVGVAHGRFRSYAFYQYKRSGGWRPNSSLDQHTAYVTTTIRLTDRLSVRPEFTLMYYLSQQPGGLTDTQFERNPDRSFRARNWFRVDWNLFAVRGDYRLSNRTNLNTRFFGLVAGRDALGNLGRIDRVDAGGRRDLLKDDFRNWGNETRLIHRYSLRNDISVALIGTRYYHGFTHRRQGDGPAGADARFDYQTPDNLEGSDFDLPSRNVSVFAENIFNITPALSFTPGIRFEHIVTEADGYYRNTVRDLAGNILQDERIEEKRRQKRSLVLFGIGISYKPTDAVEIYANVSQNYRALNFNDIRVNLGSLEVDPSLRDERGFNMDLGIRGTRGRLLNYDVSLFHLSYQDRIGTVLRTEPNPRFNNLVERTFRFRTNIADADIYGVESFTELDLFKLLVRPDSRKRLSVFTNVAAISARYSNSDEPGIEGNEVELVPEFNIKTGLTLGRSPLELTVQYSFVSEHFSDASNARHTPSAIEGIIPPYHVVDVSGRYVIQGRFRIEAGINNVTDHDYFTRRATGYPGPGIIPSPPRSIYLTLGTTL